MSDATGQTFEVLFTAGAERDLAAIHNYIAGHDCIANADRLLDQLTPVIHSLAHFPERGSYPPELLALGMREFRQTSFKPYRVIYRVVGAQVFIHLVADSRRDMQALLARRLLGA
ncbi:type II toxin-antitoxin system RelE/ParE family toxin [Roseateles sp. GG27B]